MSEEKLIGDRELFLRCLNNESGAWDILYERHKKLIWWIIHKRLAGNTARIDNEAIFQEVWIRIIRNLHQWRGGSLKSYIGVITSNVITDHIREHRRYIELDKSWNAIPYAEKTDDNGHKPMRIKSHPRVEGTRIEDKIFVRQLRAKLKPEEAELINLLFLKEMPPEEVAQFFGVSIGVIYTRKNRVLATLRKLIQT